MDTSLTQAEKIRRGAEDSGRYFRYMTEFVGFTQDDADAIKESGLIIEKHLPDLVADFYDHLLRYPPTRKHFLKQDGSIDHDYVQKRMHHLTNFWRRSAGGVYDDDYARYVDYVGRAHTSHGADPNIYIAERYVIGQVGFIQYGISNFLRRDLREYDPDLEKRASQAWNKLMMVILEMLARAYNDEHEGEMHGGILQVDSESIHDMAVKTYEMGLGLGKPLVLKEVNAGRVDEIPDGERKIIQVDELSIGIFHHKGNWYALRNHCLHRGGPVATGTLDGDTLTCPWHGYQYNVTNGNLLVDTNVKLAMYPITIREGELYLKVPDLTFDEADNSKSAATATQSSQPQLQENEFNTKELPPGKSRRVKVNGEPVAVYNVAGNYYATQDTCTHAGGPLSEGDLKGTVIICPWHGSCFDVTTGDVRCGPAVRPIKTFSVTVEGQIGKVVGKPS